MVLSNTRTCTSNPSLTIASAVLDCPLTRIVGGVEYPLPGLRILNASIIHLTSLSDARFFLYPNPDDLTLISVTNPLSSSNAVAVAPIPSPLTNTIGGSAHGSPVLSTGISIIPPLSSVIIFPVFTVGILKSSNTVDVSSPTPSSESLKFESPVIRTSTDAPLPLSVNVNVSSSSTSLSSLIPTVIFAVLS